MHFSNLFGDDRRPVSALIPVGLLCGLIAVPSLFGQSHNAVLAWNELALDLIRFSSTPPPSASRHLANLHVCMFDAVNSAGGEYASYRYHEAPPVGASPEACLAAAARYALKAAYPQFSGVIDAEYQSQIVALNPGAAVDSGVGWGVSVATLFTAERDNDGANLVVDYEPAGGAGRWIPTPPAFAAALLPQWPSVRPFCMEETSQFRPPPPPALSSAEWVSDLNQVKVLGARNSPLRTAEQTEIAWFWADGGGTETPPGHWNSIARQVAAAERLSLVESARLFALLNMALADAAIAAWDAKYVYDLWRPITAIRNADSDGNPGTEADANWLPLIPTPPFPEYVSGHSTFSGAGSEVLARFTGSDRYSFTIYSDGLFGVARAFNRFSQAAEEAGMSRIYGGIHFMAANRSGLETGRRIAAEVMGTQLPRLTDAKVRVQRRTDGLELRWPTGMVLESSPSIIEPVWTALEARGAVKVGLGEPARFFRLRIP